MVYSTLKALWGLLGTEEGRNILLEEGRRNPELLVQNLRNLRAVNREARDAVGRFTRIPEVRNIFLKVFKDEYNRIIKKFESKRIWDGTVGLEAHETLLDDFLVLKAGLVRFAEMFKGPFEDLLTLLNVQIEYRKSFIQERLEELRSTPIEKLMKKVEKLSKQIQSENKHQNQLKESERLLREDPSLHLSEQVRQSIIQRNKNEIEKNQQYIDKLQSQMESIKYEINRLESGGGGIVEEGEINELESGGGGTIEDDALYDSDGGGGGTIEDDGDILNEVDGKYQNLSMGVYYQ